METIYDVEYFIKKFEALPYDRFTINAFKYENSNCFLGHCMPDKVIDKVVAAGFNEDNCSLYKISEQEKETDFKEVYELALLFCPESAKRGTEICIKINNGEDPKYQQLTVKDRILSALYDLKPPTQPKVKTVYVSVPTSIIKQAMEGVDN